MKINNLEKMSIEQVKDKFKNAGKGWKLAFYLTQIISFGLIIGGFCVPPMGVVDGSVLTAIGEMFLFPTLYSAVHIILSGQDLKIKHGQFEISSNEDKKEDK